MVEPTESLRLGFCSLILQAKGSALASFVAWLDLKVAEYKVYGHMILTDDENDQSGAWQYTEPSSWPVSGMQPSSQSTAPNITASVPRSYSGFNVKRMGTFMKKAKTRPGIKSNLLKKARARKNKTFSYTSITSTTDNSLRQTQTGNRDLNVENSVPATVVKTEVQGSDGLEDSSLELTVKTEQQENDIVNLDTDSETEDSNFALTLNSVSAEQNDRVQTDFSEFDQSQGDFNMYNPSAPNVQAYLTKSRQGVAGSGKQSAPNRLKHQLFNRASMDAVSSMVGGHMGFPVGQRIESATPSAAKEYVSQLSQKRTPSRSSVNDLLSTHTIQTEAGYQCKLCGNVVKSPYNMNQHIKEVHLKILSHHCPLCLTRFNRPCKLAAHIEKHHPNFPAE